MGLLFLAPHDFSIFTLTHISKIFACQRIGPHHKNILNVMVGNLLGDGWFEKRNTTSCRLHIHMSHRNQEYLHWLHQFYASHGYASAHIPKMKKQIGKHGKIYFSLKFRTWSYTNLNWLYDSFYTCHFYIPGKLKTFRKRIPPTIQYLLTPQALAVWLMNDGSSAGPGLVLSTECFSKEDIVLLQDACEKNFFCRPSIQQKKTGFRLYFSKKQKPRIQKIVKEFMHSSMLHKIL